MSTVMRARSFIFALMGLALCRPGLVLGGKGEDLVHISSYADVAAISPGKTSNVGILFKIEPGWHIYWKNPGDSGLPTRIKLDLPPGFTAGDVQYPVPVEMNLPGKIVNYGYENEVMLMVPITAPKDLAAGADVKISATASWLVCQQECVKGKGNAEIILPVQSELKPNNQEIFAKWKRLLPQPNSPDGTPTDFKLEALNGIATEQFIVRWKNVPVDVQCFPSQVDGVKISDIAVLNSPDASTISFRIRTLGSNKLPDQLYFVLGYTLPNGERHGMDVQIPVSNVSSN